MCIRDRLYGYFIAFDSLEAKGLDCYYHSGVLSSRPSGANGTFFLNWPVGCPPPDPGPAFAARQKQAKTRLNLRFKNPFLGFACSANPRRGTKDCAAGFLGRRSLRIAVPSSAALVLAELRLSPFQRGTAVQGAHGLTVHPSNLHLLHQTFVPSAARQPAPPLGLCAEVSTGIGPRHGQQTSQSKGRSVTKLPRNEGGFSRNVVP